VLHITHNEEEHQKKYYGQVHEWYTRLLLLALSDPDIDFLKTFLAPLRSPSSEPEESYLSTFKLNEEKEIKNVVSKEQTQLLMYVREVIEELGEDLERHGGEIDKVTRNKRLMVGLVK
jgi:hypothetical protein